MIKLTKYSIIVKDYPIYVYNLFNLKNLNREYMNYLIDLYKNGEFYRLKENLLSPVTRRVITESGMEKRYLKLLITNGESMFKSKKYLTLNRLVSSINYIFTVDKKQVNSCLLTENKDISYIKDQDLITRVIEGILGEQLGINNFSKFYLDDNEIISSISLLVTVWIKESMKK